MEFWSWPSSMDIRWSKPISWNCRASLMLGPWDSSCYGTFQSDGGTKKFIQFIDDHDLVLKPMVLGIPHFKNPLIIFLLKYVEVPDVWGAALFHGRWQPFGHRLGIWKRWLWTPRSPKKQTSRLGGKSPWTWLVTKGQQKWLWVKTLVPSGP